MFDFAANQEVEDISVVPENFRVFYKESETGYQINSDEPAIVAAVASISGLAKSLNAARNDAKNNKVDLSPLAEFGASPAEIAESITVRMEELNKQIKDGGKAKIDVEKIKAELATAHMTELQKREAREQALTNQLYGMLVTSEATSAIVANKGVPELLMPFIKDQVQVVEQDGKMTAYVVDAENNQRYSGTTGAPMTINELVLEMKSNKQFGRVFESDTPSGPGTPPRQSMHVKPAEGELSATQKIANGLKRGLATRPGRD